MERRVKFLEVRRIKSIAFQGERGAFSESAAKKFFKKKVFLLPTLNFEDVFKVVTRGRVDAGIIPIENSLQGSVLENYDHLQRFDLFIIGEVKLRVRHHLLAHRSASVKSIREVYSHPQALAQCRSFLKELKSADPIPYYDTAGAAKLIREESLSNAAAIASAEAAKVYSLKILARGIEDNHENYTRFLVLGRAPLAVVRRAKTSIIFALKNVPGSLYQALRVFARRKINLHKIESRPVIGRPWEYLFYLDCEGSLHQKRCSDAVRDLRGMASYLKILGSYPSA